MGNTNISNHISRLLETQLMKTKFSVFGDVTASWIAIL